MEKRVDNGLISPFLITKPPKLCQNKLKKLINLVTKLIYTTNDIKIKLIKLKIKAILNSQIKLVLRQGSKTVSKQFINGLGDIIKKLKKDIYSAVTIDMARPKVEEVILCYPGFYAITAYRIANLLSKLNIPTIPRFISFIALQKTGIDIHPQAKIGEYFFIDHGIGVVIGQTAIIGNHVTIYQGVTLGNKKPNINGLEKRHPTIGNNVTIFANATILGGDTTILDNQIIFAGSFITKSQ